MIELTKTQLSCLRAAARNGGKFEKFSSIYWKPVGYTPHVNERIPNRIMTFGSVTINALIGMKMLRIIDERQTEITEAGRAALAALQSA